MRKLVIAMAVIGLVPAVHAQRGGPVIFTPYARANVVSETVKGAPYSADVMSESIQSFSDGNRIVHRSSSRVYRDSEGRTRRDEDPPSGLPAITISDPVAGSYWTLDPETRSARQNPWMPRVFGGTVNRNGELERLSTFRYIIDGQLSSFVARGGSTVIIGSGNEQSVEDKLPARTMEGVRVEGVRRTTTIPAGTIGNERPIVVTSEEWTSPELKVLVSSESNDPRTGTSMYKLVNIKRGDPPASLFQVPADYATVQPAAGGRGGRGGQPSGR